MAVELAFRLAHDSTSHCTPTSYRSPMTAELAFRHANDGTPQRPLTLCRKPNNDGVSLPTCQQRYISVITYLLQKFQ